MESTETTVKRTFSELTKGDRVLLDSGSVKKICQTYHYISSCECLMEDYSRETFSGLVTCVE